MTQCFYNAELHNSGAHRAVRVIVRRDDENGWHLSADLSRSKVMYADGAEHVARDASDGARSARLFGRLGVSC